MNGPSLPQLRALADDWSQEATMPLTSPTAKLAYAKCSKELRILIAQGDGELPTRPMSERPEP